MVQNCLISRCAIKFYEDLGFMPQPVCHQDGDTGLEAIDDTHPIRETQGKTMEKKDRC